MTIWSGLVWGPVNLVQAETSQERGLVRDSMIYAHRELVGAGCDLRVRGERVFCVGASPMIGEWVMCKHRRNLGVYGDGQRISGKRGGVDILAFGRRRHGNHLRGSQHLAKALIFAEVEVLIATIINIREHDRAAVRQAKLVAHEWRDAAVVADYVVIEIVARIKSSIAHEFKDAAVKGIGSRPGGDGHRRGGVLSRLGAY